MKFTKLLPIAVLSCGLLITACSQSNNTPSGGEGGQVSQSQQQVETKSYLDFVDANKVRFDIMAADLGITFKYGDEAVTSGQSYTMSEAGLTFEGELAKDTVNFVIVAEAKPENGTVTSQSVSVNPGIEKASLRDYLADFYESNVKSNAGGKVYVAISSGEVTWTKGLNADMDAAIQKNLEFLK